MNTKKLISRTLLVFVAVSLVLAIADAAGLREKLLGRSTKSGTDAAAMVSADAPRYAAIFYHAKHRCETCVKIEEYAHAVLQPAIDAGEIAWEVSEYTAPENRDVVRSMDVMTSTVVLAERENGKIVRFQNLEDVWLHTDDPERFALFINDSWKSFREKL